MKPRYFQVEKLAESLKGYIESYPVDIKSLCKKLSFDYQETSLDGISGAAVSQDDSKVIFINSSEPEYRKRFTGGHELCHLIFHTCIPVNYDKSVPLVMLRDNKSGSNSIDWREREANYFSACLLMPRDLVEEELRRLNSDSLGEEAIEKLSNTFGVSTQAMSIRLNQLNLIFH